MERRLEDILSRIAMETQEIKELEQQLTDGQILANEALRKELEGIISGLQNYIKPFKTQNIRAECGATQDSGLDLHLLDSPEKDYSNEDAGALHCSTVRSAEGHRQGDQLRLETEKLQRTLRKHRRVLGVCEEVWCVEQTLMKRRAELRRAQRLLQEAHSSTAQAQCEAKEWQRRAKECATSLHQTQLQLKELQDEAETVREFRPNQNQGPDLDLHFSDPLASFRKQEERLQQKIQELRIQESILKTSLQSLVLQHEMLLTQRSALVSASAEEEQGLEHFRFELDSTRTELKRVLEEVLSERQELVNLKSLQARELKKLKKTHVQLDQTRTKLDQTQVLLHRTKDQADRTETELNQAKDQLEQVKVELLKKQKEEGQKQEEMMEKQRQLDQTQAAVTRKKAELMALQQEVEMRQKEAESCLKETERQTRELQEVKKELEQRKEQSSSLQQQCHHLEDRRRHAHRCLSAVEAELKQLKQEQSQSLLTQREVMQEVEANQAKLNETSELLSFLSEKVDERRAQLQTLEQAVTAVTESEDRGRCETQKQLHKLSEELLEQEKRLLEKEAELRRKEEELHQKEAGLSSVARNTVPEEEELLSEVDNSEDKSNEEFYLSTTGLRSTSSSEEERWTVEEETDKLQLKQDSLRARLRCSLRAQNQSLQERDLEREQSLMELKHNVDRLDSLLLRAKTLKHLKECE